ncbi:MAG: hypothetical protein EXS15_06165 [Phycisphaerales bacterium]|nr:hypothetical protein [Phycisphaerales bacterium]
MTRDVSTPSSLKFGPPIKIRWIAVMFAMAAGCGAVAGVWTIVAPQFDWVGWQVSSHAFVAVLPVSLVGWLIVAPWKARPAIDLVTVWLAGTVIRLLLTPLASFAIYSLAQCGPRTQFIAAVGACYFATLLCEVAVVATGLPRSTAAKT